jgi:tetratricopeptide (TPR) repeat protein
MVFDLPLLVVCLVSLQAQPNPVGEIRAAGPFLLPGALATWLIMILPVVLCELLLAKGRYLPIALICSTVGVATLAMTFSRAAWLVGMAEISLLLLLQAGRPVRAIAGWAAFGALGLGCLIVMRHSFSGTGLLLAVAALCATPVVAVIAKGQLPRETVARIGLLAILTVGLILAVRPAGAVAGTAKNRLATLTTTDESALGRVEFWRAALLLSFQHPLVGVGPGNFSEAYPQVQRQYFYFSDSAHGALLELFADVGLVGGGLFVGALALCVARARPDPWRHPGQRAPLLGLVMGAIYSQVEIGYHFGVLATTAAFLLALATVQGPMPPPRPVANKFTLLWAGPCLAALIALLSLQRAYELSKRQLNPEDSYRQALEVSNSLPIWSEPAISALAVGLHSDAPAEELDLLVRRALTYGSSHAISYQLAGEVELSRKRYPQAKSYFTRALELDRFNRPGIFHGLLIVANATGDQAAAKALTEQVLATYDLDQGWETAHLGHRQKLAPELRPLLFDIADGMSPYAQPTRTEPIYRFLLKTGRDPRALYGLGVSLLTQGKAREGRELMRQAHLMNPIYPDPTP